MLRPRVKKITLLILISLGVLFLRAELVQSAPAQKVVLALLDTGSGSTHEAELLKVLNKELVNCSRCEVKTFPIYDKNGNLYLKTFLNALKAAQKSGAKIIHLSWNVRKEALSDSAVAQMVVALDEVAPKAVVVAAAGDGQNDKVVVQARTSLSETVMGQVKHAFLIGELSEAGRPLRSAWTGSELLTSIQPPAGTKGSSFSSLLFSAALLKAWSEHPEITAAQMRSMVRKNRELSPDAFPKYQDLTRFRK